MSEDKSDFKKATLNDLRTQLAVTKEQLQQKENDLLHLRKELETARAELNPQREELNKLTTELEVMREKLGQAKLQAIFVTLLYLFATLQCSFGINLITSTPPNSLGWFLIGIGSATYILSSIMTNYRSDRSK